MTLRHAFCAKDLCNSGSLAELPDLLLLFFEFRNPFARVFLELSFEVRIVRRIRWQQLEALFLGRQGQIVFSHSEISVAQAVLGIC